MTKTFDLKHEGLDNFGSTCYANSALQLLFCSKPFMMKLDYFFSHNSQIAHVLQEQGFALVTPYFLSCGLLAKASNCNTSLCWTKNKPDILSSLLSIVGYRNAQFAMNSGQQSSAEFLLYLLHLLRIESELLHRTSFKSNDEILKYTLQSIENDYNKIDHHLSINHDKLETPIDEYFYNRIDIYHKCSKCEKSQFKCFQSQFAFECSHRYFINKQNMTQVCTSDLLDLYFHGDEVNVNARIPSFDACRKCGHNHGIQEMRLSTVAKEVLIIYDRIDVNIDALIPSPRDVTSIVQKRLVHWKIEDDVKFNNDVEINAKGHNTRLRRGAIFHNGQSYEEGHYITVSLKTYDASSPKLVLFNDLDVCYNSNFESLFLSKESHLIEAYGTAVVALYSNDVILSTIKKKIKRRQQIKRCKDFKRKRQRLEVPSLTDSVLNTKCQGLGIILQNCSQTPQKNASLKNSTTHDERKIDFDCTHRDYEDDANTEYSFKNFHSHPETAVLLHHFNAGRYDYHNLKDDLSSATTRERITNEIQEQFVSNQDKENIIRNFDIEINGGVNNFPSLLTCGCCGIREFIRGSNKIYSRERGGVRYKMIEVRKLTLLQYKMKDVNLLKDQKNRGRILIPINESGENKSILPEEAISYFHDERDDKYYHLHREFVSFNDKQVPQTPLCLNCLSSIFPEDTQQTKQNKPMIPTLSLAAGFDFGDYNRLGLTEPNRFEQCILSKVRRFITILKIKDNRGQRRDYTQQTLKGHAITFDHDAPVVTSTVIDGFHSTKSSFRLQLICENGKKDHLIEKIMGSSIILGRPFVLRQWLLILKRINILYSHDDVPCIQTIKTLTMTANKNLLDNMIISHDDNDVIKEVREGDDVAQVRSERFNAQTCEDCKEDSSK